MNCQWDIPRTPCVTLPFYDTEQFVSSIRYSFDLVIMMESVWMIIFQGSALLFNVDFKSEIITAILTGPGTKLDLWQSRVLDVTVDPL